MKKSYTFSEQLQNLSAFTLLLVTMCVFSISLSLMRAVATGSPMFLFLNWNLILAIVPLLFTRYLSYRNTTISRPLFFLILGVWLLFFPNSPYILTDLFHLKKGSSMPLWFDLILILSYAWAALVFGFKSLHDVEKLSIARYGKRRTIYIIITLLFVASFGVYLGRYLRWNSWDILLNPFAIMADIADRILHPIKHLSTWGMTLMLGTFLNLAYFSLALMRTEK